MSTTIHQGESLDFSARLNAEDMTLFTCQFKVKDSTGSLAINRQIIDMDADQTEYRGRLTATESAALTPSTYTMSTTLSRADTDQAKEICQELIIEESCG